MSLDLTFFKEDVDFRDIRERIDNLENARRTINEEIDRLEDDYSDAKLAWLNITHNLNNMAKAVGLYEILWPPKSADMVSASRMTPILENGIKELESDPDKYRAFDAPNGWGKYEDFIRFCRELLHQCKKYPDAVIERSA
jgi:hypothetical protein